MKHVYCIYNNLTRCFMPFEFRADDFESYSRQLHDYLLLYPEQAQKAFLHISTLYHIGTFDEETALITYDNDDRTPGKSFNIQQAWDQLAALKEQVNGGKQANPSNPS